ncbi:ABC transporter permease [Egibacter rhizosphaerae]|uniref:ABC transporter permease n=1 Tax=Egibacter rhizosphaerae TaxID=1670831 RepID=A0A411YBW8_9ACTN|nr:ABC transporter permease [Egibacter rhizosphaerae]QBI18675.1 ABC transporter permease [Egibacter rhizosphaerae]
MTRETRRRIRQLATFGAIALLWEAGGRLGLVDPFYLPPPSAIGGAVGELFVEQDIWSHAAATFGAALGGLALGVLAGIVLGFLAALSPWVSDLVRPVMGALNAIPRVILAPLLIIWLGVGISSKVALSFLLVAVLFFFSVYSGIEEVDRRLVERVRSFGGGTRALVREVYVPSVTAWVLSNLRVAVGFAFTGAVVGEFVVSSRGIGYLLGFAQSTYNAPLVFGLILLVMVVVLGLFSATGRIEQRLLAWRG